MLVQRGCDELFDLTAMTHSAITVPFINASGSTRKGGKVWSRIGKDHLTIEGS